MREIDCNCMLQELALRSKGIARTAVAAFCGLSQLLVMNLGYNELTSAPHLCPVKYFLEAIHLEHNKISTINKNYLEGFTKLKEINLSDNDIITLPDLHWVQHSLSYMRAANNYATSLEAFQTPDIFEQLVFVYMSANNIDDFNVTILRHMPKLTRLLLNANEITHVDDFRSFYEKKINLLDNPWHCGAALSWMGEEDMEFEHGLVCATPVCRRDVAIANMSKLSKPCNLNTLMMGWNGGFEIDIFVCKLL